MTQKKSLLQDLFGYIKKPTYPETFEQKSNLEKLWLGFRVWSLQIFIGFGIGILIGVILKNTNWDGENAISELAEGSWLVFFLAAVIIAPLVEEATFRSFLRVSKINYSIFYSLFTITLLNILENFGLYKLPKDLFSLTNWWEGTLSFIALFGAIFSLFYFLVLTDKRLNKTKKFVKNHFKTLFHTSTILFGVAHIGNYSDLGGIWYILPLLALPQTIGGFGLAYIRSKFGLIWSIAFHAFNNLVPALFLFGISNLSDPVKDLILESTTEENIENLLTSNDIIIMNLIGFGFLLIAGIVLGVNIHNMVEFFKKRKDS